MYAKTIPVIWGCFFLWNLYSSSSQTIYPGIKARVTQRALDYGVQAGMEMIGQMLKERNIPDLQGSESLDFLKVDYVDYNFSNIKINAFSFPNTSLAFVPGVGIKALTNHGTANVSTNWAVKSPLFKDAGGANLFLSGVYFTGNIILNRNDFGQPLLKLEDCYAQVSHAHVSFFGQFSVLYNSFAEPMEKPILKNLNEMLCPIITGEVEALNVNLSTLEVLTKIDNYTLLDYSIIDSPEITENSLDVNFKGTFYPLENLVDPPFSPAPFVLPERSDSMLYIGISEYFFKSASFAYYTAGAFDVTFSTKEISNHLIQNSQGLGNVLSRIADIYILAQPFMVRIMATEPPIINLQPGNFSLDIPASIMMLTQPENSTMKTIVSMDFVASTSVGLVILGQRLICSLSLNRFWMLTNCPTLLPSTHTSTCMRVHPTTPPGQHSQITQTQLTPGRWNRCLTHSSQLGQINIPQREPSGQKPSKENRPGRMDSQLPLGSCLEQIPPVFAGTQTQQD
uniref:Bactericidal permeability-increasing protein n=1 Tax=Oryctolagus cuniculus TaxID=9986 RepID=A0A5F9DAA8_RABIT